MTGQHVKGSRETIPREMWSSYGVPPDELVAALVGGGVERTLPRGVRIA